MMKLWIPSLILAAVVILAGCARGPTAGTITTVAGTGVAGSSGDGGPATEAQLNRPISIAMDAEGNLYIAESAGNIIRRLDPNGIIATVAGTGTRGRAGEGGPATEAELTTPSIALGPAGDLFIAEHDANRIRRISAEGIIMTVVGTGSPGFSGDGGPATEAEIVEPHLIAFDALGNLYLPLHDSRVRKIDPEGTISTVAGTGEPGYSGDGGPATEAQLKGPQGVAVDSAGSLYIADTENDAIRKVDANGTITTVAGTGTPGYSGDGGPAAEAQLRTPIGLAFDAQGNLYIADSANQRIRRIDPNGIITTVVGTRSGGFSGDGGDPTQAQLKNPFDIWVDATGNLFFADTFNHRVRKVTF